MAHQTRGGSVFYLSTQVPHKKSMRLASYIELKYTPLMHYCWMIMLEEMNDDIFDCIGDDVADFLM